jgi:hypothetical protein
VAESWATIEGLGNHLNIEAVLKTERALYASLMTTRPDETSRVDVLGTILAKRVGLRVRIKNADTTLARVTCTSGNAPSMHRRICWKEAKALRTGRTAYAGNARNLLVWSVWLIRLLNQSWYFSHLDSHH